jgi:hypothetical protein
MHPRKSQRRPHTRKPEANPKLTKLSPKESHRRFTAKSRTKAKHDPNLVIQTHESDEDYESEEHITDFVLENNTHHLVHLTSTLVSGQVSCRQQSSSTR